MKRRLIDLYKRLFVRKAFYRLHRRMLNVSLWGLGILNSENHRLSGEDHFLRHLPQYLSTGQAFTVFDVGANIGTYAREVKALYPQAIVHAFEPHPETYVALQRQAEQCGYYAHNLALGNVAGQALLFDRPGSGSTHASLYRDVIEVVHHETAVRSEVHVTTLDRFTEEHGIARIHLLKLDTEGSEMNILQGARSLLEAGAIDVIQFEFNDMNVVSRVFFSDFYTYLSQYALSRMLPDGLVPIEPHPAFLSEIFAFQNLVAIRRGLQQG